MSPDFSHFLCLVWKESKWGNRCQSTGSLSQLWGMLSTPFWPWQGSPQQLHSAAHTPRGTHRLKYFTGLPSFSNHWASVLSLLLTVWAAGMFWGQWTQLTTDLRGRQIKSFWVEKFQFNNIFYLVLNQWGFFFFSLPSAVSGFDAPPCPLSISVTLPRAQECAGGTAAHTSPHHGPRCRQSSYLPPTPLETLTAHAVARVELYKCVRSRHRPYIC